MRAQGLYDPANEHDACGAGFVAHIKGQKSHSIIEQGLQILKNIDHRAPSGADRRMGAGAGLPSQMPDPYCRGESTSAAVPLPPAGEYGVGMIFRRNENASRVAGEQEPEGALLGEGQVVPGWRDVLVDA